MKPQIILIPLLLAANITLANNSVDAESEKPEKSEPVTLDDLLVPAAEEEVEVTDLRSQVLEDAGYSVGLQGGLVARAKLLIEKLDSREKELNQQFQFSSIMTSNGNLPPIIVEAQDLASFEKEQIRTASRVYKIHRPEKFVSVPPTWRDYLYIGLPLTNNIDLPDKSARPKNSEEQEIWEKAVKKGWKDGHKQADEILEENFNRLTRDFVGMMRYSILLQNNMISKTQVAETQQTVTGDENELIIGDKHRRFVDKAKFETDSKKWEPSVTRGNRWVIKNTQENRVTPIKQPQ
ncbi:type IV secretory system conjugative DNA transfer family protein [Zooshikella marina]|uniref:type IV secretory system conjugative DNA transfer family protein n=1 Tax=Zooshikella ganghwensis TaxID=202772 RepID=UPI001BB0A65A|nr:type IV secretory system conjugative DNA transfer family protein [Zooshikella ganghwensis]MBU2708701.1 type IV secretory system conjugative DNA transfer family protein [Zooshikella ganghwensis]